MAFLVISISGREVYPDYRVAKRRGAQQREQKVQQKCWTFLILSDLLYLLLSSVFFGFRFTNLPYGEQTL